ncbi:hypothetical protein Vadar_022021 [Vaccinium darrowii]|uniref:Uncharacterized protein n=1 Tax=Vaccinium darrowii TaxID=229202 RepID=A0ACB7YPV1_9ERIC|nr:hypothetical protein Vadar_022021 [Vaccinium darrowii]
MDSRRKTYSLFLHQIDGSDGEEMRMMKKNMEDLLLGFLQLGRELDLGFVLKSKCPIEEFILENRNGSISYPKVFGRFRTEIEWYPVKCLAHKILKKKRNKWSKNAKLIMKTGTYMWAKESRRWQKLWWMGLDEKSVGRRICVVWDGMLEPGIDKGSL